MRSLSLGLMLSIALVAGAQGGIAEETRSRLGTRIENFTLEDAGGKSYSLADFADCKAVVVVFLGVECPLAKLYAPRLVELAKRFKDREVAIIAIDSNQQDSLAEMAAFARRNDMEFPLLKDPGNRVADHFAAARTPEAFVLDAKGTVRYCGRIDDQYGFNNGAGFQRPEPTRDDLVEAVRDVLEDRDVRVAETQAAGCIIGRQRPATADSKVTYSNQIARLFQARCLECHREGQIGPFSMESYDEIAGWGEMIREVVSEGRMPPWHADPTHGDFVNDSRLSEDEKQLVYDWVDNGCPEGDASDLPPAKQFAEGWTIGEPDQIVYMSERPFHVPARGVIDYKHYLVDPHWDRDMWICGAEPKPGSPEVVHHILVFIEPPRGKGGFGLTFGANGLVAGYAPGANPTFTSDGSVAMRAPAGSKLRFQLHYTPNGKAQTDRSYLGLRFVDPSQVTLEAKAGAAANVVFRIPPRDDNYEAGAAVRFRRDTLLLSLTPHMHMRGKSFRYEAVYPDGVTEILLDVPRYDFNWQTTYQFREPKRMPKGTTLRCTAHWDNSENNLSNPDPDDTVYFGDQTWDEMMIGFFVQVSPRDPNSTPDADEQDVSKETAAAGR